MGERRQRAPRLVRRVSGSFLAPRPTEPTLGSTQPFVSRNASRVRPYSYRLWNVLVWTHLKFVGCHHNSHSSTFSLTGRSSKARTYQAPGLRPSRSCAFFLIALGSIAFDPIYSEMSPTSSLWLYLETLPAALNGKSNSTIHLNVVGALKARDLPNALSRQRFVSSLRGP